MEGSTEEVLRRGSHGGGQVEGSYGWGPLDGDQWSGFHGAVPCRGSDLEVNLRGPLERVPWGVLWRKSP
jgi:hypothetical protein